MERNNSNAHVNEVSKLLSTMKTPGENKKEWINIHDLIIGSGYALLGMVESDYIKRDTKMNYLERALAVKDQIVANKDFRTVDMLKDKTLKTWLSGHYLSNALHRISWLEERMFDQIITDFCKEKEKPRSIYGDKRFSKCKCPTLQKKVSELYKGKIFIKTFPDDGTSKMEDYSKTAIIRNLVNKQKHTVKSFELTIKLMGSSLDEHMQTLIDGLAEVVSVYNHFN